MRRGFSGSAVMKAFGRLLVAAGALVTASACFAAPPAVYSQAFGGQSCNGCHGTPFGADSIIVNGSQTGSGAAMRTLMDNVAGNPMDAILGFVTDGQLNTIRLWLIEARDGIFAVQAGSSTNFGSAAVGSNGSTQTFTITNERGNAAGFTTAPNTSGDFQVVAGGTCGATVPATSSCTVRVRFEPTASGVRNGSVFYRFSSGGTTTTQSISLTGTGFVPTPGFSRTPATLTFVGRVSPLQTDSGVVTITNPGGATANLIFSAFNFSRPEFTRTGGTCAIGGLGIAPGVDCTVNVTYTPSAVGAQNGSMTILHNAPSSPDSVTLNATGTQSLISPTAATVPFGNVQQGNNRLLMQNVSNTGTATLNFTVPLPNSPAALSGAAAGDYTVAGCAAPVGSGLSCTLSITFTPSALGSRPATLTISSDATNGPLVVTLTGAGVVLPEPVVTGPSSDFPDTVINEVSAQTRTITINNPRANAIVYSVAAITDFSIDAESCATRNVPGGGSCTLTVTFRPTLGAGETRRTGSYAFGFTGTGGNPNPDPVNVPVAGNALLPLSQSATTINAAAVVGSPTTSSVILTNRASTPITLTTLAFGGAAAADYSLGAGNTCTAGLAMAASSNCTLVVRFNPPAAGTRNATLTITHSAAGSPQTVSYLGIATPAPQGRIELSATNVAFADTQLASTSAQTLTVQNSGDLALTFSAFTFGGANAAEFSRSGTCSTATPLPIAGQCTLTLTFAPAALGVRSANLVIASDASNGAATITMSGNGVPIPAPQVTLAPVTLDFGTQTTGGIYPARRARLVNSGTADLAIASIVVAGAGFSNVSATACPAVLAPGAGCDLDIALAATSAIAYDGTLTVTSNAAGSPHTTLLRGIGTASAVPVLLWSPVVTQLDFGSVSAGSVSAVQSANLLNQGPGGVNLTVLNAIGADAASFSVVGGTCAIGAPLFEGETCRVDIRFAPGSAGAKSATVQVASTGSFPPALALSGIGLAGPNPSIALSASSLAFGTARVGTQSLPSELRLISNGSAAVRVTALAVTGPYTIQSSNCPSTPFTLVAGTQCTMAVAFVPSAEGAAPGVLRVSIEGDPVVHEVALSGNGEAEETSGGGCSLATGRTLLDPTLWLLVLLAAWVLVRRQRAPRAGRARSSRP